MTKTNEHFGYDHYRHPEKKITRIELRENSNGSVYVEKYKEGWTASSQPAISYTTDENTFDGIVKWLSDRGWKCYTWYQIKKGKRCRAFLGKPMPIRTREEIQQMRDLVASGALKVPNGQADLAYMYDFAPWMYQHIQIQLNSGEIYTWRPSKRSK
jgi:hypothetical protein